MKTLEIDILLIEDNKDDVELTLRAFGAVEQELVAPAADE